MSSSSPTSAVVIITGGGGFLGVCLARELLQRGTLTVEEEEERYPANKEDTTVLAVVVPIQHLILADVVDMRQQQNSSTWLELQDDATRAGVTLECRPGDLADRAYCDSLFVTNHHHHNNPAHSYHLSIFHLGAVMSGDGERDFDLCLRVNLYGSMHLLEAARQWGHHHSNKRAKFILASAGATMGTASDYTHDKTTPSSNSSVGDCTRAIPHTTYGMTKACTELLLSDYTRRQFVDGRGVRLPTIVVRAGQPNAATTSCYSAVIRESLAGINVVMPIAPNVKHAVSSARSAVQALLHMHNAPLAQIQQVLGYDRTVFLPAQPVSLQDLHQALTERIVHPDSRHLLGRVTYTVDETLSRVVGSFPTHIDAQRALALGVAPAPTVDQMIREYSQDFGSAIAAGIQFVPRTEDAAEPDTPATAKAATPITTVCHVDDNVRVAVITGAGSGIGRAVAIRLSQETHRPWILVLAGRRLETLQETQTLLCMSSTASPASLCVPTDVTNEDEVEHLFHTVADQYGRLDLLFNNAGTNVPATELDALTLDDWHRVLHTNVTGPFLCARAAVKLMKQQHGRGGGRIINNGSLSAQTPRPGSAPYTVSKHALLGLTKCLALDGRAHHIACGQVDFGNVETALSRQTNATADSGAMQPNGTRLVEPFMELQDAAETVYCMANLPVQANVLQMTVMATQMPFVGRG